MPACNDYVIPEMSSPSLMVLHCEPYEYPHECWLTYDSLHINATQTCGPLFFLYLTIDDLYLCRMLLELTSRLSNTMSYAVPWMPGAGQPYPLVPPQTYKCDSCPEEFKTNILLKYHKFRVHNSTRPYVCRRCYRVGLNHNH